VNVYLMAAQFERLEGTIASGMVLSTALAAVTTPLWVGLAQLARGARRHSATAPLDWYSGRGPSRKNVPRIRWAAVPRLGIRPPDPATIHPARAVHSVSNAILTRLTAARRGALPSSPLERDRIRLQLPAVQFIVSPT